MNLIELYEKTPVEKHDSIKVIGDTLLYDSGTEIYQAYIDQDGELIPANQSTKTALAKI